MLSKRLIVSYLHPTDDSNVDELTRDARAAAIQASCTPLEEPQNLSLLPNEPCIAMLVELAANQKPAAQFAEMKRNFAVVGLQLDDGDAPVRETESPQD